MDFNFLTLPNGIRLIHKPNDSDVAYFGLMVNAGSRNEDDNEHGLAHFLEHAFFKGTSNRNATQIINSLENVGGDLNAYTTKEETCIHATFLNQYYNRTIELISDIVFHSVFPDDELKKESKVIIDEINSYKDSPSEMIFDEFDELLFPDQPLGRNILGTAKSVKKFRKVHFENFIRKNYGTDQIVLASVGKIPFPKLEKMVRKHFEEIPASTSVCNRTLIETYSPIQITHNKKTFQSHCILGNRAYSFKDDKRIALSLLNNILCGSSMNSRLNMVLREKNGYSYNVESAYMPYYDTGAINIYFGTDKQNLDKCIELVLKEFDKLSKKKIGNAQLHLAKQQMIGQIAVGMENKEGLLLSLAKSYLVYNEVDTLEQVNAKLKAVTAEEILEIANEILDPQKLSMLIYK
jgi:predicted Zn-dependent peptidase